MNEATLSPTGKPLGALASDAPLDPKAKYNGRKVNVQYVPPALIAACSEALDEGRIKYGCAKWRETKTEMMTYLGGVLRHIYSYIDGEDLDPESLTGKTHLAGAVASLAILLDGIAMGNIVDNRPPKGPVGLFRMKEAK